MKTLAARMFIILLVATVAIQVLSFGGVLIGTARIERAKLFDYLAHDVKLMRAILLETPPAQRQARMALLQRGFYEARLQAAQLENQPIQNASLDETVARVQGQLGADIAVTPIIDLHDADHLPGFEVPLDAQNKLLILFPNRAPPYPAPPLGMILSYLAFVSVCVVGVAWYAVRQITRPLRIGAQAARTLADNLDAPPLSECGPVEVVEVSRAFNQMQRAIRQHLDERTQILASISHDLKTPLTRLRLRVAELDADERRTKLEADIDAMNTLVQEGLDYARSTQLREALVPVDLNPLIESIAEQAVDTGQTVDVSGRLTAPVRCAPRALARALQNLVDNALKYGQCAHLVLAATDQAVEIRVEDEGPGLPNELLAKVFEPFFRAETSRSRETGGTGLGLSIAQNLIRAQGGQIHLENRTSAGLAAVITLPM